MLPRLLQKRCNRGKTGRNCGFFWPAIVPYLRLCVITNLGGSPKMMKFLAAAGAFALLASGAFAADLVPAQQVAAEMSAVNWSGPYLGANVGYGPGTTNLGLFTGTGEGVSFSGLFVGGQVGYNYQLGNDLVFGLEGDLNWSNESGTTSVVSGASSESISSDLNWFGGVTGHVGYAWDNVMPYLLGGVSVGNNTIKISETCVAPCTSMSTSDSATHMGYTVGLGVAAMLATRLSGFVEVRYADYGSSNYTFTDPSGGGGSITLPASLTDTTVRAGLNFHF